MGRINPKSNDEAAKLLNRAHTLHSEYTRLKHADDDGIVSCYTCPNKGLWNSGLMHLGHYLNRRNLRVTFHKFNTKIQCSQCNINKGGNIKEFGKRLKAEDRLKFFKMIKLSKTTDRYWTILKLKKKIKKLTHKISELRSQKHL